MRRKGQRGRGPSRALLIRFNDEEAKGLHALLCNRKLTGQTFCRAAIMRAVKEASLGKKAAVEIDRDDDNDTRARSLETHRRDTTQGLGIRDRLNESREDDDDDYAIRRSVSAPSTNATISAPVLAQSRTIDDTILVLARTVVASSPTTRRATLKDALSALTRGHTLEESVRIADDLDAAIQRLDGVPRTALERVRARTGR